MTENKSIWHSKEEIRKWLYNNVSTTLSLHPRVDFNKTQNLMYDKFAEGFIKLLEKHNLLNLEKELQKAREEIEELCMLLQEFKEVFERVNISLPRRCGKASYFYKLINLLKNSNVAISKVKDTKDN